MIDDVTNSTVSVASPLLADISLTHGWVPITVQVAAAVGLALAIGWRSRRWWLLWLPTAVVVGIVLAAEVNWYIRVYGLANEPTPRTVWLWTALSGVAAAVVIVGWRTAGRWRRAVSILAVPLCLLSCVLAVNAWVGYFPTVQNAWNQLTDAPLPDQTDKATVGAIAANRAMPPRGSVVSVTIPATGSNFKHRSEIVYLPPAWFASSPPPKLPTVMMIGGEFNTPEDWLRAGNAVRTVDDFAAAHGGNAPVLVFVDSVGTFNNDTECVNGTRGNAADHLVKDVVPYMISNFGVSPRASHWGIVGWSMGGTCAVDLTVMHPDLFSSYVDIAGDIGPNTGTKAQTIARLFGGNAGAWAAFDPSTVIATHGRYSGVSGWFAIASSAQRRNDAAAQAGAVAINDRGAVGNSEQAVAAESLCALGRAHGIDCAVVAAPGKHDWPFADNAFKTALPWLAGQLGTPAVARIPLPAPAAQPARPVAAPRNAAHS